jgi:hypothetical protein
MPELVPPPGGYPETTKPDAEEANQDGAAAAIDSSAIPVDALQTGAGNKRAGEVGMEGKPSKKAKADRKGKNGDLTK